jgi:hypothetical protein
LSAGINFLVTLYVKAQRQMRKLAHVYASFLFLIGKFWQVHFPSALSSRYTITQPHSILARTFFTFPLRQILWALAALRFKKINGTHSKEWLFFLSNVFNPSPVLQKIKS